MHFEYPLLEALEAVVREGSFADAARSLNVNESTVRERVGLLEDQTGAVLVIRGRSCDPTDYGQQLCRHLDQVRLLEQDLRRTLAAVGRIERDAPSVIRVAVNADSLATWFPEVVEHAGSKLNLHFEVIPDDQEHTAERLRVGEALAAITSEAEPLSGCRLSTLGAMEYTAVASGDFIENRLGGLISPESLSSATYLVYDRKDTLPLQWVMTAFRRPVRLQGHWIPSFSGHLACLLNGSGWGIMPRFSIEAQLGDGSLRELAPGTSVTVPLYWQSTTSNSETMAALSSIVSVIARKYLLPHETSLDAEDAPAASSHAWMQQALS